MENVSFNGYNENVINIACGRRSGKGKYCKSF